MNAVHGFLDCAQCHVARPKSFPPLPHNCKWACRVRCAMAASMRELRNGVMGRQRYWVLIADASGDHRRPAPHIDEESYRDGHHDGQVDAVNKIHEAIRIESDRDESDPGMATALGTVERLFPDLFPKTG